MVLYFLRELDDRSGSTPQHARPQRAHRIQPPPAHRHAERRGRARLGARCSRRILSEGHIRSEIVEQFGVKSLEDSQTHFLSLLYFLGMLTLGASPRSPSDTTSRSRIA
jgi:hypothetical protein